MGNAEYMGTVSKRLLGREEQYLVIMKLLLLSLLGCVAVQSAHHEEMKQIMKEIHTYNLRSQCWGEENVLAYEILRREAQETLDPSDPAYDMYKKKPTKVVKDKHVSEKEEKKPKRERLIINPEFVESLDQGDGSVQYDEDYTIDENEV